MAQFVCEICGEGFEQKSRYERHVLTSHPPQAPDASDLMALLKGMTFPRSKQQLLDAVQDRDEDAVALLKSLPEQEYRDSAEVARALASVKGDKAVSSRQPSKEGGKVATQSDSAAAIVKLFSGISFPANTEELKRFAKPKADERKWAVINRFAKGTYRDMADVAKEIGRVTER